MGSRRRLPLRTGTNSRWPSGDREFQGGSIELFGLGCVTSTIVYVYYYCSNWIASRVIGAVVIVYCDRKMCYKKPKRQKGVVNNDTAC